MPDTNVPVRWQIAADEHETGCQGRDDGDAEFSTPVHVDVRGLKPGQWYWVPGWAMKSARSCTCTVALDEHVN